MPKELFSVEEVLKELHAAVLGLKAPGLDKTEVIRLRGVIAGCRVYKEMLADYMDYRGLEAELMEWRAKYEALSKNKQVISISDIAQKFGLTPLTARNYLSRLAQTGEITNIGRGLYQVGRSEKIIMRPAPAVNKVAKELRIAFPMAEFAGLVVADAFRLFSLYDWKRPHVY